MKDLILFLLVLSLVTPHTMVSASTTTITNQLSETKSHLSNFLQNNSNNSKILTNMGGLDFDDGNYSSAISDFKKALSIDSHQQAALLGLGEIIEVMGGSNITSENYFRQILTIPATTNHEKLDHVISLTHLGHYSEALNMVNQVLKSQPLDIYALIAKGDILLYQKNYTSALTIFNHILITHPILAMVIDTKAISIAGLGKNHYEDALKLFQKSVSLNPKDVTALYNIGVLLDHMRNFTGAFAAYAKAQNLTPHNKDILWNEGITLYAVLYQNRNFSEAVRICDTMLKISHNPYLLEMRNDAESILFESMCCVGSSLP